MNNMLFIIMMTVRKNVIKILRNHKQKWLIAKNVMILTKNVMVFTKNVVD